MLDFILGEDHRLDFARHVLLGFPVRVDGRKGLAHLLLVLSQFGFLLVFLLLELLDARAYFVSGALVILDILVKSSHLNLVSLDQLLRVRVLVLGLSVLLAEEDLVLLRLHAVELQLQLADLFLTGFSLGTEAFVVRLDAGNVGGEL